MPTKIVQHLEYGPTAAHVPTWVNTTYKTLAEARRENPNEPPNFYRLKEVR